MTIRRLFTGALFQHGKPGIAVLSVAQDGSSSRITTFDKDGHQSSYRHAGPVDMLVDRPTRIHDPRIVAWEVDANAGSGHGIAFMLNPNKIGSEQGLVWCGRVPHRITRLQTGDIDFDQVKDLAVRTSGGAAYLDFQGRSIGGNEPFTLFNPTPRPARRAQTTRH